MNKRVDAAIGLGLGATYAALLLGSTSDLGYTRDEGFYFAAASRYGAWFRQLWNDPHGALVPRAVDAAWSANHEHPAFVKSLFALSNLVLEQKLHLFAMEGTSYRFPAIVLAGLLVALVYAWGATARGRVAGVAAAVSFAAMPRVFFHAHLACFDVPMVALWTATAFAYDRSLRTTGWRWPLLTGIAFGLALDTKHNSWFLPFAFVAHAVAMAILAGVSPGPARRAALRRLLVRSASALGAMAAIGPPLFVLLWPWIWHDTLGRIRGYAAFHLHHDYYNMVFFGRTYFRPPMPLGYAWVMTLATVPTVTLVLAAVGLCLRARANRDALARWVPRWTAPPPVGASTDVLWMLGVLVNYAAWLSPNTPIFGGTKHWMTAYPFLALFAGVGAEAVVRVARREIARARSRALALRRLARTPAAVAILVGVCLFTAPVVETAHAHPWGLSSYVPLVGGAPGGATLGFNRTFWGYTTASVADYLNANAPKNASIYIHDTAMQAWDMFVKDGRIRPDLRPASSTATADFALYHHEEHMEGAEYQAWLAYGTDQPAFVAGLDGVPVIWVYRRAPARPSR